MAAATTFQYSTAGAVTVGNNAWRNLSPHGLLGFSDASPWLLSKLSDLPTVIDPRNANRRAAAYVDIAALTLRVSTFDGAAALPSLFLSFISLPHLNAVFGHIENQWTALGLTATDVTTEEFVELVRDHILTGTPAAPMILSNAHLLRTEVLPAGNTLAANGHDWVASLLLSHCGVAGDPCDLAGRLLFWTGFYLTNASRCNANGPFYRAVESIKSKSFSDNTGDDQLLDPSRHGYPVEVAEAIGEWFQRALPSTPKALLEMDFNNPTPAADVRLIRVLYQGTAAQKEREMAINFGEWICTCPSLIKVFDFHLKAVFTDRGLVPKYKELLKTFCPNATDPFDHGTTVALDSILKDVVPILDVESARIKDFRDAVQILIENKPMAFSSGMAVATGAAAGGSTPHIGTGAGDGGDGDDNRPSAYYDKDFIGMVASVEFTAMALAIAQKSLPVEKFQVAMSAVRAAPRVLLGVMQFLNSSLKQPRGHSAWKDLAMARDFGRDLAYGRAAALADPINRDRMQRRNEFRLSLDLELQVAKCLWHKVPWGDIAGPLLKSFIAGQSNLRATDPALLFTTAENIDEVGLVISEILSMWGLNESAQNSKSFLSFAASLKSFIRSAPTHLKASYGRLSQKLVIYALELSGRYHLTMRNGPINTVWHNDFLISGVHDSLLSELAENQQVADMVPVLARFIPGLGGKSGNQPGNATAMIPPTGSIAPFQKKKGPGKQKPGGKPENKTGKSTGDKDADKSASKTKSQLKREKFIKRILENAKDKDGSKTPRGATDDTSHQDSDNSGINAQVQSGDQQLGVCPHMLSAPAGSSLSDQLLGAQLSNNAQHPFGHSGIMAPQHMVQPHFSPGQLNQSHFSPGQFNQSPSLGIGGSGIRFSQNQPLTIGQPGVMAGSAGAMPMYVPTVGCGQLSLGGPSPQSIPTGVGNRATGVHMPIGRSNALQVQPSSSIMSIPRSEAFVSQPSGNQVVSSAPVGNQIQMAAPTDLRSQIQLTRQTQDLAVHDVQNEVALSLPHFAYLDSGDRFLEGEELVRTCSFKLSHEYDGLLPSQRRLQLKSRVAKGFSSTLELVDFCRVAIEALGKGSAHQLAYDGLTEEDLLLLGRSPPTLKLDVFQSLFLGANTDGDMCTVIDDALLHLGMLREDLTTGMATDSHITLGNDTSTALSILSEQSQDKSVSKVVSGFKEIELLYPYACGTGYSIMTTSLTGENVFITDPSAGADPYLMAHVNREECPPPSAESLFTHLNFLATSGLSPHKDIPYLPEGMVAVIEVWSGLATMSFVAAGLGAVSVGLIEKKARIRTGVAEALGNVPFQATDFYDGEWESWNLSEVRKHSKYLILLGGASCKAFAKCGYQGSLNGSDVRALDVVHTSKMAGALSVDFCTIEITVELLDMNHRHGLFDQTEAAFADQNFLLISTQKVIDSQIGGYEFRARLILHFARRDLAAQISSVPMFPVSAGVLPLSNILLPVDQIPDFLIFTRGALKAVPEKQLAPFKPKLAAILKWGGPRYSFRVGSKVAFAKDKADNQKDQKSRFFITMITRQEGDERRASLIKAEPFGERTDPKLRKAPLQNLIHLSQYVGVYSIDNPALALRAFGEGLQGNSMLILDTRLSPPAARCLTHLEKWRLHGLCDELFFFLRDTFKISERELSSCAGEAITMAMAAVIVYSLFTIILILENLIPGTRSTISVVGASQITQNEMDTKIRDESEVVQQAGGFLLAPESLADPSQSQSAENAAAVMVDVSDAQKWKIFTSTQGRLPAVSLQQGCKRPRAVSRITDLITKLVKAPVSSAVIYVTLVMTVWMTTHFLVVPLDEMQVQTMAQVGEWSDFNLFVSSPFGAPMASCLTKIAAFSMATISQYRGFSMLLKTGARDPVPLSRRVADEIMTPNFDWFDYSALVEKHLRNRLIKAAKDDPFFADWAHQIANDLPSDLPSELRHLKIDYSHQSLMTQRFSDRYIPPKTERVPRPVQRRQPRHDFSPTHLGDLLLPEALELISRWVVSNMKRMDLQRRGYKAGVGERLAIGQDLFTDDAKDIIWDLRRMNEGIIEPLDFSADIVTHLDRKAISKIFASYPDQELIGFLLDGVQWKVDPAYQLVLLPHLVSLPNGYSSVEKELYRLKDRGWYHFFPQLPFVPWRALPQGSTARKLEPDRWRRTTDGGAPRMLLLDTEGIPVTSINDMANVKGSRAVADGLVPPVEGEPWWVREVKPKLEELMRDLAVLLYAARHVFNEPPLVFGDDCFNYFSQFALCPATIWLAGLVWLDTADLPPSTLLSAIVETMLEPIFIVENVLGFGLSPNSGICQRMSHAIVSEFMRRMDASEQEYFSQYTTSTQKEWIQARKALGPGQLRLYSIYFYTDDAICVVVGHERMERALKIWNDLLSELGFIMAIPEKRVIGTSIIWLGFRICVIFGLIVIPSAKLVRMLSALTRVMNQEEISFKDFRSLVGLLVHLRPWLGKTVKTDFKLWFAGYSESIAKEDDEEPVFISPQLAAQASQFHQWLQSHSALPAISEAPNFSIPALNLSRTTFLWIDAAKEGVGVPGIGGYSHGKAWHLPLSPAQAALPIVVLETLAVWAALHLFADSIDAAHAVLICTDATAAFSAAVGDAKSKSLSYLSQLIRNLPVFKRNEEKLWICHCWGEGNCIGDYCSRGLLTDANRLASLLGVRLQWVDIQPAFITSFEALAESVSGMVDMSLPEFHKVHNWFGDLKVFGARFQRPIAEHQPGLCTFEALADCGVAPSTEDAVLVWRLNLEECIQHPSGEVAVGQTPLLQIMKMDAISASQAVLVSQQPEVDYPGLTLDWARGVQSVDPELPAAEWIYTVCFGLGHMFGSLVSLHILASAYNVGISVCIPADGKMLRVGNGDSRPKAVIRLHDQHATVSAIIPEAVDDVSQFGPTLSQVNIYEAMGSSISRSLLSPVKALAHLVPRSPEPLLFRGFSTESQNESYFCTPLVSKLGSAAQLSLNPAATGSGQSTASKCLFDFGKPTGVSSPVASPTSGLVAPGAIPVLAGKRLDSRFQFESKSLEDAVLSSPFQAELRELLKSAAWSRWKDFCRLNDTPEFRSDAMANSGLDPIGFKEEQNLYLKFLEYVKPLVVAKHGPEAKPKSVTANLHSVRRVFTLLNFTVVPLPFLKKLEKKWTKDFAAKHGSESLLPRRKEPLTAVVILAMLTMVNYDFGYGMVDPTSIFWCSYLAMVATSASAGFRRAEVSSSPGGFSKRDLCRSSLKWIINGSAPKADPTPAEFASMKNHSSFACISPAGSKGDPGGNYWGQHQIFLPLDSNDPMNAADRLRSMELIHPCHGEKRSEVPLFSQDVLFAPFNYQRLDHIFQAQIKHLFPNVPSRMYSWHSFRIFLACALLQMDADIGTIQALCRWKTVESLQAYARLTPGGYGGWLRNLGNSRVTNNLVHNIPRIGPNTFVPRYAQPVQPRLHAAAPRRRNQMRRMAPANAPYARRNIQALGPAVLNPQAVQAPIRRANINNNLRQFANPARITGRS